MGKIQRSKLSSFVLVHWNTGRKYTVALLLTSQNPSSINNLGPHSESCRFTPSKVTPVCKVFWFWVSGHFRSYNPLCTCKMMACHYRKQELSTACIHCIPTFRNALPWSSLTLMHLLWNPDSYSTSSQDFSHSSWCPDDTKGGKIQVGSLRLVPASCPATAHTSALPQR